MTSKQWREWWDSLPEAERDMIDISFVADLAEMESLAIGGDGETHFYYKDAYEAENRAHAETEARREAAEASLARIREAMEKLQHWQESDAVLGNGEYHQGLLCGVEDRGYQKDGYLAMRYGYDRALERVSEEIDDTIKTAIFDKGVTE